MTAFLGGHLVPCALACRKSEHALNGDGICVQVLEDFFGRAATTGGAAASASGAAGG